MKIETQLRAIHDLTGGDLYDADYRGGEWMVEAVQTHETIDQFIESAAKWAERSKMQRGTIAGMPCVVWERVQAHRGQPRRSMAVIDMGDVRYAVDHTLSDWMDTNA